jgi:hypothetical protein
MRAEATINQKNLDGIGANLEDRGIASYEPPPSGYEVKSADSVMRKMRDEGYGGAHEITDYSRASFVIDHPAEAEGRGCAARARHVYDKGWQYIERTGYLDRKVYLQHAERRLVGDSDHPAWRVSGQGGTGHRLYEIARLVHSSGGRRGGDAEVSQFVQESHNSDGRSRGSLSEGQRLDPDRLRGPAHRAQRRGNGGRRLQRWSSWAQIGGDFPRKAWIEGEELGPEEAAKRFPEADLTKMPELGLIQPQRAL